VNWDTTSTSPPTSSTERFMRPSSSSKMRRRDSLPASRSASAAVSPSRTPTRTSIPGPIDPTVRSPTRTSARATRCTNPRIVTILLPQSAPCYPSHEVSAPKVVREVGEYPPFFRLRTGSKKDEMHQVTQLQTQVETMLRDGFPDVEVLLVDKPTPNRVRVFID